MKIIPYYFENYDSDKVPFDKNNPRFVLAQPEVDEVIFKIAKARPDDYCLADFEKQKDLIAMLVHTGILALNNHRLRMASPIFLKSDIKVLKRLSQKTARTISDILNEHQSELENIVSQIENGFDVKRNMYHLLCGNIFDGMIFDDLAISHLVTTSNRHASGLDYLVILYENDPELIQLSDGLLCSYNRYQNQRGAFVSFGDSMRNRHDFYRMARMNELGQLSLAEAAMFEISKDALIDAFIQLYQGEKIDQKYMDIFTKMDYVREGKIVVPVYERTTLKPVLYALHKLVISLLEKSLEEALTQVVQYDLVSLKHHVKRSDIANEVYHLIFGQVNEYLVSSGMVLNPEHDMNEGRYFKCFEIK